MARYTRSRLSPTKLYYLKVTLFLIGCLATYILVFFRFNAISDGKARIVDAFIVSDQGYKGAETTYDEFSFDVSDEYFKNERMVNKIDCRDYFVLTNTVEHKQRPSLSISLLSDRGMRTCAEIRTGFITSSLTKMEESFELAYSIVMFKDAAQVWTLLQGIYRPQNTYCIHVDKKSSATDREAIIKIASCFHNVFVASQSIDVVWGTYSVLEPDIVCMVDLWTKSKTWRYFINLTGQEFSLKTNYELVKILTAYDGANDVEGGFHHNNYNRWSWVVDAPDALKPVKGAIHVILSRKFVDYIVTEGPAKRLLDWCKVVGHSSEVFFSTLNFNPHLNAPGAFGSDNVTLIESKPFLARYKIWVWDNLFCSGPYMRNICILHELDLPYLVSSKALFANKFHWKEGSKVTEYCISEYIYNRTKDQYIGKVNFDDAYYRSLSFVKLKIR